MPIPAPLRILLATMAVAALLAACSAEEEGTLGPEPPIDLPTDDTRPEDPGLSYDLPCLADLPIENPLRSGALPDAIPALNTARFLAAAEASYLQSPDLVYGLEIQGVFLAFPARILHYHEIANFTLGESRYAASWCPLSFSFLGVRSPWDRSAPERRASFRVSGALMDNNLVFFDVETRNLWPQLLARSTSAADGRCLEVLRNGVATTWDFWRKLHPETLVLSNQNEGDTGIPPSFYGTNPYVDFHNQLTDFPWPFHSPDNRLSKQEVVLGIHGKEGSAAVVVRSPVGLMTVGGTPVVILSHLASRTSFAFENDLEGVVRNFLENGTDENGLPLFRDAISGSNWSIEGIAVDGPLAGTRLGQVPSVKVYWAVWASLFPDRPIITR